MNEQKPWYTSKTLWINLISGLGAFLEGEKFIDIIPDNAQPYVAALVFGLNIILRYITVTEIKPIMGPSSSGRNLPMILIALGLGSSLFVLPACSRNPNPAISPERTVALYGIRANSYLKETRVLAEGLYTSNVLPKPAYDKFLVSYIEVNKAGEQLAKALAVYDAATSPAEKNALVPQIDAALATLGTLLPTIIPEVTDAAGRAKVAALVGEVQKLVITIARLTAPRTTRLDREHSLVFAFA